MHFQKNIAEQRAYIERQRSRARLRRRLSNGIRELIKRPWKFAPLVALVALFLLVWNNRDRIAFTSSFPMLNTLGLYAVKAFILLLFVFAFLTILAALGTPLHAKRIETALSHACVVDRYNFPPMLVSRQRDKSGEITTMIFFSRGISKELWEKRQRNFEDVLNVRWIEDARYGGKRGDNGNYIVLTLASGTGRTERGETLYDEEL